jgi:hypothetical protein
MDDGLRVQANLYLNKMGTIRSTVHDQRLVDNCPVVTAVTMNVVKAHHWALERTIDRAIF